MNNRSPLLRLLYKIFRDNEGEVLSKETIVYLVWKKKYNPSTDDNTLYVTINRLRKTLPNEESIKILYNGYRYMNNSSLVSRLKKIVLDYIPKNDKESVALISIKKITDLLEK